MRKVFAVISCLTLTACAAPNMTVPKDVPTHQELTHQAEDQLMSNGPSIIKMPMPKDAFMLVEPETGIPPELDVKIRNVQFFNSDVQTILFAIAHQVRTNFIYEAPQYPTSTQTSKQSYDNKITPGGVSGSSSTTDRLIDKQDRQRQISITYNGRLSGFLKALEGASGYFFRYDPSSASIIVKEHDVFNVTIPNYTNLKDDKDKGGLGLQQGIETNLRNLGATDISYDVFTSSLSFTADYNGFNRIKTYLKSLRENAALVTLQVLLLEVNLSNQRNAGIDWSKLVIGAGSQAQNPFGIAASNQNSSTSGSSTSTGSVSSAVNTAMSLGAGAVFGGTGAEAFFEAKNFSLTMLLNFLNSYGHYSISQNIRVESMSGTKGKFSVLTKTPYVDAVQFTALSQQSSTATAGFTSKSAKSGVELEIVPYYNRKEGSLSMALKMDVTGVTQMVSLQAGSQFGTINQPEETVKTLENFLRMSPSHIAVIGGLTYEKLNNHSSGLPGENYLSKNYTASVDKTELVLVVKPTIYEFE